MKGKPPKESHVEMVQQVLPGDTNPLGSVFGGRVMEWIDISGAVAAMRHARQTVVTASFDRVDFHAPARNGDIMVLTSWVNYTGKSSLEVSVDVRAENFFTGERVLTTQALITYVAIDRNGRPTSVAPLIPETSEEKKRFKEGETRHKQRKVLRAQHHRSGDTI